ncbi:hypothetical protein CROQUDRAFT_74492 [Cronartium quercuum f. sp. fusiforme G11]|uniref:Protein MON2 homolog n=1 Tax=Cronartium quercuum f. sp. fusiforme G11 TaxID=708437 RepID=A0A9P6NT79_9BASI|nr:hypothetical protein CROQUDRAFT_74492 [Cronartium quercuum f. sp. fusiforme G11]
MANVASSSNLALLVSDFQALASETKRKHADVREAAEKALNLLKSSPDQVLASLCKKSSPSSAQAEDIIKPIFMGCGTKNVKVVAIALGSLQRLISMDAVPSAKIPQIVTILTTVLPLGVEIQLRILQTLPSLFSRCSLHLHDSLLADALLLCFRLQDSRIGVVSSTSAATLRQLVMVVFEGVAAEDQAVKVATASGVPLDPTRTETDFVVSIPAFEKLNSADEAETTEARQVVLRPSAKDAYLVFEDLCLLVNGDSPSFLKLQSLPKTFGLELIESVMTGHSHLFQQHPELIFVLRAQLCPLLIRAMSEKPVFALTLRLMRVAFLLLKQFCDDLLVEAEVFLSLLIKTVSIDHTDHQSEAGPIWLRVLALEIFRGLCADFALLMRIYERYDLRRQERTSGIFTSMMSTLNRLASEKPHLLGIHYEISSGPSFAHQPGAGANIGVQGMIDGVVGMATQAAAPLVGSQQQGSLTLATATMKLQCIDQLDKAEAPPIPETYVYLLSLQCLSNVAEGFATFTLVKYEEIRRRKPAPSPDGIVWAPAALNLDNLKSSPDVDKLKMVKTMADASWPALLASLSFFVSTNLDDDLFAETLSSMQSFTYACGVLNLSTPRDAFLLTFCKFAVPSAIVANIAAESSGSSSMKPTQSVLSVDMGIGSTPAPTSLSTRSYAFLRTVLSVAQYLAGSLDATWYTVFDTLQNAEFVLNSKSKRRAVSTNPSSQTAGQSNNESDEAVIQTGIQKLFDCSRTLNAPAFTSFVASLCRLSAEMVGLISDEEPGNTTEAKTPTTSMRRRASGMNASRTLRPNERSFGVTKLGAVALLNIRRIISEDPQLGWAPITSHLLAVQRHHDAPSNIRLQAADALDQILLSTPKHILEAEESDQRRIQSQIIEILSHQTEPEARPQTSTDLEVRKLGFDTLFKIMENNGHSFIAGWLSILDILRTACPSPLADQVTSSKRDPSRNHPPTTPSKHPTAKISTLIRTSFPSLQLICTDFLTALNLEELRQCISVLAEFGRQTEDINIALTAGGLLWQVSDHVQGKNKSAGADDDSYVRLWMYLLSKLLKLSHASRQEVRDGAIQTLFRTIGLYGNLLSEIVWYELLWEVVFPLINFLSESIKSGPSVIQDVPVDNMNGEIVRQPNGAPLALAAKQLDDSKILVLESTGKVLFDHMSSHILKTPKFRETWEALIHYLQHSFMYDRPAVGTVAMRTMATILTADLSGVDDTEMINSAWEFAWDAVVEMSKVLSTSPDQLSTGTYFTQTALEAYIKVIRPLQTSSRLEMSLERVQILLNICKVVVTYTHSPDFRSDVDALSPLQAAVLSTLDDIELRTPGAPSALIILLSDLSTLVFSSSFDASDPSSSRPTSTHVSYVAICKEAQPRLVKLYAEFRSLPDIYNTGATSQLFRSFAVPLRLKYKCPTSFKFGKALPLWKTATASFLSIVRGCLPSLMRIECDVDSVAFKDVWAQLVETFSVALVANCGFAQTFELNQRHAEENFDLALIGSLEVDVLPHLGACGVPDAVISSLAKALQESSRLYNLSLPVSPSTTSSSPYSPIELTNGEQIPYKETRFLPDFGIQAKENVFGTSAETMVKPHERFAYWCFDLLFVFCGRSEESENESKLKRVAALCLPALLDRCSAAVKTYVADAELRGRVPFPRIRDEEIVYILQRLLSVPLWDGCLAASYSQDPSSGAPDVDRSTPSDVLVGSLLARGTDAHLLYLQPQLLDLLSLDVSSSMGEQKHSTCLSGLHNVHNSRPFRDLLQATDRTGAGLEGCWSSLALGKVGVLEPGDKSEIRQTEDMKQLVLMCLRRIQARTAVVLG